MFPLSRPRSALAALGTLLTVGLVWQSTPLKGRVLESIALRNASNSRITAPPAETSRTAPRVIAEGLVVAYPGAEVVVGTEASGLIVRLLVQEKSVVHRGDLIAELNAADLRASLAEAIGQVAEAQADIRFFGRELHRDELLLARNASTAQNLDTNRRGLDAATARLAIASASRDRFEALIAKTRITAPIDGVVTARHVHAGETVQTSARIVTIADLSRVRIEAEVDEFDSGGVSLAATALISAEGYPGKTWRGTVEEIPDAIVGRRIRPEDPGRPIDARVLPVKIAFGEPTPLKLGQRVEIAVIADSLHSQGTGETPSANPSRQP